MAHFTDVLFMDKCHPTFEATVLLREKLCQHRTGAYRVAIRLRPLSRPELANNARADVTVIKDEIFYPSKTRQRLSMKFDRVFPHEASQSRVYNEIGANLV